MNRVRALLAGLIVGALAACTFDGPATVEIDGQTYSVGVVRGLEVSREDLSLYSAFTTKAAAYFLDNHALALRDVDPGMFPVARAAPGLTDDAGSWGPFVGLWRGGQDSDLCRYFTRLGPDWCANVLPPTDGPAADSPSPSAIAVATAEPGCIASAGGSGPAMAGIADLRPEGWTLLRNGFDVGGFPDVDWQVYGPDGSTVPPREGPARLALYESWSGDAYFESRAATSREAGGTAVDVTVCDSPTQVWVSSSTGELVLGWTLRGKSDVLVANIADYTVEQLVEAAEHVNECCG